MINAGDLIHRVTIQKPVYTTNEFNEKVIVRWADVCMVHAAIRTLTAKEIVTNSQVKHLATHEVQLRYRQGITSDHRVKYGCRTFQIDGIDNVEERDRELLITCHEPTAGGNAA